MSVVKTKYKVKTMSDGTFDLVDEKTIVKKGFRSSKAAVEYAERLENKDAFYVYGIGGVVLEVDRGSL